MTSSSTNVHNIPVTITESADGNITRVSFPKSEGDVLFNAFKAEADKRFLQKAYDKSTESDFTLEFNLAQALNFSGDSARDKKYASFKSIKTLCDDLAALPLNEVTALAGTFAGTEKLNHSSNRERGELVAFNTVRKGVEKTALLTIMVLTKMGELEGFNPKKIEGVIDDVAEATLRGHAAKEGGIV